MLQKANSQDLLPLTWSHSAKQPAVGDWRPDSFFGRPKNEELGADWKKAIRRIESKEYQAALSVLRTMTLAAQQRNVLGVCLLRTGAIAEAVSVFKSLCVSSGTTWIRPETPACLQINFATAVLLNGSPARCLEVLAGIPNPQPAMCQMLRDEIKAWSKGLPLWKRIDWWIGHVEPQGSQVQLAFEPGVWE